MKRNFLLLSMLVLGTALLTNLACKKTTELPGPFSETPGKAVEASSTPKSYLTGNAADVTTTTTGGTILMGGSTDVDAAMLWMLNKSGGGDIVIIRASGADGYNDYLFNMAPVNSVETLLINTRAKANNADAVQKIRNAEALFIAGGDQYDYVNYWKDTGVEDAINYLINTKHVPVGGTSAGCAVLGKAYFSAQNGTVLSADALANPYNTAVQVGFNDFVNNPYLTNTITDTHYNNPDRKGRHVTFMARIMTDLGGTFARGVGVEEQTAVCIDQNGIAKVFGTNKAYFLQNNNLGPETCVPGSPLTWNRSQTAVKYYAIQGSSVGAGSFDFTNWTSYSGGTSGYFYVNNGVLTQN